MITTKMKSIDTIGIIATTSSLFRKSLTGIGSIVIPVSTATTCGLSFGNKVIQEIVLQTYNNYKEQYDEDLKTLISVDKIFRKMF